MSQWWEMTPSCKCLQLSATVSYVQRVVFQIVTAVPQCVRFFIKLPVPQWKPMCVTFCPFAMSVTVPLMVFAFMASFHLPLLPCSHTLCQACQHVTFTKALGKGQWSTVCVWILHPENQSEPRSFGIILIKLPCYSQNGNQVSLKLCQTMSWTQAW